MLVLSRKKNDEVVIGGNIRVKILEVRGERVRLGIDAPLDVPIHRSEVYQQINNTIPSNDRENDQSSFETFFQVV